MEKARKLTSEYEKSNYYDLLKMLDKKGWLGVRLNPAHEVVNRMLNRRHAILHNNHQGLFPLCIITEGGRKYLYDYS